MRITSIQSCTNEYSSGYITWNLRNVVINVIQSMTFVFSVTSDHIFTLNTSIVPVYEELHNILFKVNKSRRKVFLPTDNLRRRLKGDPISSLILSWLGSRLSKCIFFHFSIIKIPYYKCLLLNYTLYVFKAHRRTRLPLNNIHLPIKWT